MSIRRFLVVSCDDTGTDTSNSCEARSWFDVTHLDGGVQPAREHARAAGWMRYKGHDYCPLHAAPHAPAVIL